jgi:hypothetical protein
MDINDFGSPSKYLAKEDVPEKGMLLTIKSVVKAQVGKGAQAEQKPVLVFMENVKPMVCNKTNAKRIAQFTGISTNVDRGWVGVKIVVYFDPMVEFGGDIVGGLRIRAPRMPAQQAPIQQPQARQRQTVPPPDAGMEFPPKQDTMPGESVPYGYDEQGGGLDGEGDSF